MYMSAYQLYCSTATEKHRMRAEFSCEISWEKYALKTNKIMTTLKLFPSYEVRGCITRNLHWALSWANLIHLATPYLLKTTSAGGRYLQCALIFRPSDWRSSPSQSDSRLAARETSRLLWSLKFDHRVRHWPSWASWIHFTSWYPSTLMPTLTSHRCQCLASGLFLSDPSKQCFTFLSRLPCMM
jgi:hypothetical protein